MRPARQVVLVRAQVKSPEVNLQGFFSCGDLAVRVVPHQ